MKGLFYFFVASIAFAPTLYIFLPISPIFRSIRMYEIIFVLVLFMAFLKYFQENESLFRKTPVNIPVLSIVFLGAVSLLHGAISGEIIDARDYFALLKPIRLFLIFQMVMYYVKDRQDIYNTIFILIAFSLYPEFLGILELMDLPSIKILLTSAYSGYEFNSNIVGGFDVYGTGFLHKFRASSVYAGDVNAFGGYAALFFTLAFMFFLYEPNKKKKFVFSVICAISLYGIMISGSRKAIAGIVISILFCSLIKMKNFIKLVPIFLVSAFVVFWFMPLALKQRFFEHWEYKIQNIYRLWKLYLDLDLSSLILGNGNLYEFGMDSFYLMILFRNGLLGLLAYAILVIATILISSYVIKNARCWLDEMVGLMALVCTVLIEWLNVTGLYSYSGRLSESYWVLLGSACVLCKLIKNEKTEQLNMI